MSKRAADKDSTSQDGQSYSKAPRSSSSATKRPSLPPDGLRTEMGEFEDEWEDEIESDDEVVDRAAEELDSELFWFSPVQ